jgi:hypothetical protein
MSSESSSSTKLGSIFAEPLVACKTIIDHHCRIRFAIHSGAATTDLRYARIAVVELLFIAQRVERGGLYAISVALQNQNWNRMIKSIRAERNSKACDKKAVLEERCLLQNHLLVFVESLRYASYEDTTWKRMEQDTVKAILDVQIDEDVEGVCE